MSDLTSIVRPTLLPYPAGRIPAFMVVQAQPEPPSPNARTMGQNVSASRLAPPTKPPSTFSTDMISPALSGFTEPPYRRRSVADSGPNLSPSRFRITP